MTVDDARCRSCRRYRFFIKAFFNTRLLSGVEFLLSAMGFEEKVMQADLLITAEGKVDKQTLQGKGPMGVAVLQENTRYPASCWPAKWMMWSG
jgi:glycerate kinase